MKKSVFLALTFGALVFTACSKDDDKTDTFIEECQTCNLELLGESISTEICDNGDGTITLTVLGQEEIQELDEGVTFAQFINAYEEFGATCN
mgnify:CR=1 FL=1|jgi:hypothetical protein